MLPNAKALDDLFSKLNEVIKVIKLCVVCSVIGDQRDDAAANNKCHRKCTLAQPI